MKSVCESVILKVEKWRVLYDVRAGDKARFNDVNAVLCTAEQSGLWLSRHRGTERAPQVLCPASIHVCPEDGSSLCLRNCGNQLPK